MRLASLLAAVVLAAPALAQTQTALYPGLSGEALLQALDADYSPALTLGYNPARDSLYAYEQRTDGALCGVYTRFCIQLTPGADPSTDAFQKGVNAEHTWPQSMGAADEPSRSDLHHLFPAKANVNSSRGNTPYGEVPDAEADGWYRGDASQSARPSVFVDEWSEKDNDHPNPAFTGRFEPREDHAGNAARAVFYYRTVYPEQVAAYASQPFFDVQLPDLLVWHDQDPVDLEEYARSAWIAGLQGTPNPFVLDATLASRAFGVSGPPGGPADPPVDPTPTDPPPADPPAPPSAGTLWVNELHYDNDGADTGEGVEIAGAAGADLAGWTLALYNGTGGAVYQSVALSGTLPDQQGGVGTAWVPVAGLQNGAPDGLALVAPDGSVVQFLSYEGVLTATDGPASGTPSVDVGVAEASTSPAGWSLQLTGAGKAAADFAWQPPDLASPGQPNLGQTFGDPAPPPALAWVNELHYDDAGTDQDEGFEIAGTAGLDLAGWTAVLYNGATGAVYDTVPLSGTVDDEGAGLGAVWVARPGVQNGAPDGLALVDADGVVVEFLSYEGAFTAADGPAAGLASTDLGVSESGTEEGRSLQLAGTGRARADFAWAGPQLHSRGEINPGQTVPPSGSTLSVDRMAAPSRFRVELYPNPARDHTTVAVELAEAADLRVEVYDALGRRVARLATPGGVGFQPLPVDLRALPAGVYVVRVTAGTEAATRRVTVLR